jgi:cytochrome c oxidase subunit II
MVPAMRERCAGGKRRRRRAILAFGGMAAVVILCCVPGASAGSAVRTVTVHAVRYEFDPAEITLKKGETVQLVFIADDVAHGIAIDGLGVDVDLPKHKPQAITITPAQVGDFDGECSKYCGTGHSDMTFTVHVQP